MRREECTLTFRVDPKPETSVAARHDLVTFPSSDLISQKMVNVFHDIHTASLWVSVLIPSCHIHQSPWNAQYPQNEISQGATARSSGFLLVSQIQLTTQFVSNIASTAVVWAMYCASIMIRRH